MQHLFAFSSQVKGAAIAAGSPYGCGAFPEGHLSGEATCFYGGTDVAKTVQYVKEQFNNGLIDDPANLKLTPINVFQGKQDYEVYPNVSKDIVEQLKAFVNDSAVEADFHTNASHVWPLDHFPDGNHKCTCGACAVTGSYTSPCCDFNNCGDDLSGRMFQRSYGPLLGKIKPRVKAHDKFMWINQWKYMPPGTRIHTALLQQWGIAYIPHGCNKRTEQCGIHVNYHGCIDPIWKRRKMWISGLDLNEYGEANNVIILYPQAKGDNKNTGIGCWNWGFPRLDKDFDTKKSLQLRTVMNMVEHLQNGTLHHFVERPHHGPYAGPPASEGRPSEQSWLV